MYWPYKVQKITSPSESDSGATSERTVFPPLADLHAALHDAVLAVRWFGQSKLESYYIEQWLQACGMMEHKYSHLFPTSSTVTFKLRKLAMGCRSNVGPTHSCTCTARSKVHSAHLDVGNMITATTLSARAPTCPQQPSKDTMMLAPRLVVAAISAPHVHAHQGHETQE
jgi:hypothetical protein